MLKVGAAISFAGQTWEIYGVDIDSDGVIVVLLIEPEAYGDCEFSAMVAIRDLSKLLLLDTKEAA